MLMIYVGSFERLTWSAKRSPCSTALNFAAKVEKKFTVYTTGKVVPGGTKTELSDLVDAYVRKGTSCQNRSSVLSLPKARLVDLNSPVLRIVLHSRSILAATARLCPLTRTG